MIEQSLHDFLGDLVVDQSAGVGVPELVTGYVSRFIEAVGDMAVGEPVLQVKVQRRGGHGPLPVGVGGGAGEQHSAIGVAAADPLLLSFDRACQGLVEGHHRVAAHFVVAVVQVGGTDEGDEVAARLAVLLARVLDRREPVFVRTLAELEELRATAESVRGDRPVHERCISFLSPGTVFNESLPWRSARGDLVLPRPCRVRR